LANFLRRYSLPNWIKLAGKFDFPNPRLQQLSIEQGRISNVSFVLNHRVKHSGSKFPIYV
jgi:hypothetical protein